MDGGGVLPRDAEDEAGEHAARGMRALRALGEPTTDVLLADLDRWRRTDAAVETAYGPADAALADALWSLVAASETDGSGPTPERTLDASEVGQTLQGDGGGALAAAGNDPPHARGRVLGDPAVFVRVAPVRQTRRAPEMAVVPHVPLVVGDERVGDT